MSGAVYYTDELGREAMRLLLLMMPKIHLAPNDAGGSDLEIKNVNPELIDGLSAFLSHDEDDEDDGSGEDDGRLLLKMVETLLAPAPRQGYSVAPWLPPAIPDATVVISAEEGTAPADVAQLWPNLVRR